MKSDSSQVRRFRGIAWGLISLFICSKTFAIDYEVAGSVSESDSDFADPSYNLEFSYFLDSIEHDGSAPNSELSFTKRIRQIDTSFLYRDNEFTNNVLGNSITNRLIDRTYSGSYIHRSPESPHALSSGFQYTRTTHQIPDISINQEFGPPIFPGSLPSIINTNVIITPRTRKMEAGSAFIGYDYYLNDNWTVGAEIRYQDRAGLDGTFQSIRTKRLWSLNNERWFGLEASIGYQDIPSNRFWNYNLEGKYYLNPKTSLGIGIIHNAPKGLDIDTTIYSGGISHYLNDSIFIELEVSRSKINLPIDLIQNAFNRIDTSDTTFGVKIGSRF